MVKAMFCKRCGKIKTLDELRLTVLDGEYTPCYTCADDRTCKPAIAKKIDRNKNGINRERG